MGVGNGDCWETLGGLMDGDEGMTVSLILFCADSCVLGMTHLFLCLIQANIDSDIYLTFSLF